MHLFDFPNLNALARKLKIKRNIYQKYKFTKIINYYLERNRK